MTTKEIHLTTVKRYAELNNVDRSTVQRWLKEGRLNYFITPKGNKFVNPHEKPAE